MSGDVSAVLITGTTPVVSASVVLFLPASNADTKPETECVCLLGANGAPHSAGLHNRNLVSHVLEAGSPKSGVRGVSSFFGL